MGRIYTAEMPTTSVSGAKSLIQLNAPSDAVLRILECYLSQQASETSEQLEVRIVKSTTAGTGTAGTAVKWQASDSAFGGTFDYNLTVEPTKTDIYKRESFNILNGWIWIPNGELIVPPSGRINLELMNAPAGALSMVAGIIFEEIG